MNAGWLGIFLALFFAVTGKAANTEIRLVLSNSVAQPGEKLIAALQMKMKPGWHVYWRNAGDAGMPPEVNWTLPQGIEAGPLQFPPPEKMVLAKLFAYVYEDEVLFPFHLTLSTNLPHGEHRITGSVEWLECDDSTCLPQSGQVEAVLTIGQLSEASPDAGLIREWINKLPTYNSALQPKATWEKTISETARSLIIEWTPAEPPQNPDFFPYESENYLVEAKTEVLQSDSGKVRLRKQVTSDTGAWPEQIPGLVLDQTGPGHHQAYETVLKPDGKPVTPSAAAVALKGDKLDSLWAILAFAFLGGMILNIMPCVLPVIALKILGFVHQSRENSREVRQLGILYGLGVIASFLVLAGFILLVRGRGTEAVWGMQMQNPIFVMSLIIVIALVTLNLFGIFDVVLPGKAMGAAAEVASRGGRTGAFYNGVLATLLATPCTAPALAVAVGSAIAQPAHVIVLTFLAIGLGLAFPYVLLSWNPAWMKFLPKPGAWMEKFKVAMGFPMLATTIWLIYIATAHFGEGSVLWLGIFLVLLAAAAWTFGEFVQRGRRHRGLAGLIALGLLGTGYFWVLEGQLSWRNPPITEASAPSHQQGGIPWQKWSPEAVAEARAEGRPVFIDFTARWCFTCQVNKASSIEIESVRKKLADINAVALLADFTSRSPQIAQAIKSYNRAGIPLVVVHPADPNAAPIILEGLLTPNSVLQALEQARANPGRAPVGNSDS